MVGNKLNIFSQKQHLILEHVLDQIPQGPHVNQPEWFHIFPNSKPRRSVSMHPNISQKKAKKINTVSQRRKANSKERTRTKCLSEAMARLRSRVPTFTHEKLLSWTETLKMAFSYITFMTELLATTPRPGERRNQIHHGKEKDLKHLYDQVTHL